MEKGYGQLMDQQNGNLLNPQANNQFVWIQSVVLQRAGRLTVKLPRPQLSLQRLRQEMACLCLIGKKIKKKELTEASMFKHSF